MKKLKPGIDPVALRFIHVSQNEKFAAHLGAFLSGNSISLSRCFLWGAPAFYLCEK